MQPPWEIGMEGLHPGAAIGLDPEAPGEIDRIALAPISIVRIGAVLNGAGATEIVHHDQGPSRWDVLRVAAHGVARAAAVCFAPRGCRTTMPASRETTGRRKPRGLIGELPPTPPAGQPGVRTLPIPNSPSWG